MRFVTQFIMAFALLGSALSLSIYPALSREEIPAELREYSYSARLGACEDASTLGSVISRFNATERQFWGGVIEIVSIEKPTQVAFRPHGLDLIPRRYCTGEAVLSNATRAIVNFAIIEGAGVTGLFDSIQYCVVGYDRNFTAMGECRRFDR